MDLLTDAMHWCEDIGEPLEEFYDTAMTAFRRKKPNPQRKEQTMTLYNVHIYREMKLRFDGIEAASPEAAANIARDGLTEDADDIERCDGETFAALVDVVGDEDFPGHASSTSISQKT